MDGAEGMCLDGRVVIKRDPHRVIPSHAVLSFRNWHFDGACAFDSV